MKDQIAELHKALSAYLEPFGWFVALNIKDDPRITRNLDRVTFQAYLDYTNNGIRKTIGQQLSFSVLDMRIASGTYSVRDRAHHAAMDCLNEAVALIDQEIGKD